jgi:hypothetical protein
LGKWLSYSKFLAQGGYSMATDPSIREDAKDQGREDKFIDEDRMVNEGLGGGEVTEDNGLIEETTTDTMEQPESIKSGVRR